MLAIFDCFKNKNLQDLIKILSTICVSLKHSVLLRNQHALTLLFIELLQNISQKTDVTSMMKVCKMRYSECKSDEFDTFKSLPSFPNTDVLQKNV